MFFNTIEFPILLVLGLFLAAVYILFSNVIEFPTFLELGLFLAGLAKCE